MALIKTLSLNVMDGVTLTTGSTSNHYGLDVASYYNIGIDFDYTIGVGATGTVYLKFYAAQNSDYSTNKKYHLMTMQFTPSELEKHFSIPCLDFRNFVVKVVNDTDSSITVNVSAIGARVS
jgi:hypothetical protein